MITYQDLIVVRLAGIPCGFIHENPGGWYYLPIGYDYDPGTTKVYPTLSLCKAAVVEKA